jgi:hypothetical protein
MSRQEPKSSSFEDAENLLSKLEETISPLDLESRMDVQANSKKPDKDPVQELGAAMYQHIKRKTAVTIYKFQTICSLIIKSNQAFCIPDVFEQFTHFFAAVLPVRRATNEITKCRLRDNCKFVTCQSTFGKVFVFIVVDES